MPSDLLESPPDHCSPLSPVPDKTEPQLDFQIILSFYISFLFFTTPCNTYLVPFPEKQMLRGLLRWPSP